MLALPGYTSSMVHLAATPRARRALSRSATWVSERRLRSRAASWALCLLGAVTVVGCNRSPAPVPEPNWAALAAERLPMLGVCDLPNAPEPLLCGTFEVWEDRAAESGRRIPLYLVVVPAQTEDPPSDPVVIFEGGPGGAATQRVIGSIYAGPVRQRDIVLVDQRGAGKSNPLDCEWNVEFREGQLREMFPVDGVRACAESLAGRADVRRYTSAHHADDIEELRRWLGYDRLNLRGGSYGTSSMRVFAQRHPQSVRTMFGIGSTSPVRSNLAERGRWTDRTVERLAAFCANDAQCAEAAPGFDNKLRELLASLEDGPRRVELADPLDADAILTLDVGRDWLGEQLRLVMYYGFTSRALPWAVEQAHARGDWAPLVTLAVQIERSFRNALATGVGLTIQCSEGMDFDVDEALALGADTIVGNYRLEQQVQGCANWPHDVVPKEGVEDPQVLDIPHLLLSGALDPVTPPEYADEVATLFPNSLNVVLPEGQHGPFDLENSWTCVHRIWADFLDAGSLDGLDVTCTESMTRAPFVTDADGWRSYVVETLIPSTG